MRPALPHLWRPRGPDPGDSRSIKTPSTCPTGLLTGGPGDQFVAPVAGAYRHATWWNPSDLYHVTGSSNTGFAALGTRSWAETAVLALKNVVWFMNDITRSHGVFTNPAQLPETNWRIVDPK